MKRNVAQQQKDGKNVLTSLMNLRYVPTYILTYILTGTYVVVWEKWIFGTRPGYSQAGTIRQEILLTSTNLA